MHTSSLSPPPHPPTHNPAASQHSPGGAPQPGGAQGHRLPSTAAPPVIQIHPDDSQITRAIQRHDVPLKHPAVRGVDGQLVTEE